jgi:hypothetical protein
LGEKTKKNWVQIMLRLEPDDADRLSDLAHSARVPMAVFCRGLLLNKMPPAAPPLMNELSNSATRMLQIAHASVSNLTQLQSHAADSLDPSLNRLARESVLLDLRKQVEMVGLNIKSGSFTGVKIDQILALIEGPSAELNSVARALNEDRQVSLGEWGQTIKTVRDSLAKAQA